MSFTHGDLDYGCLERLAPGPDRRARVRRLSFAAHFDSLMFGRRGVRRPPDEASPNPYRQRFAAMFARLRREHGVRCFLTHNMTVTPANLGQVAGVMILGKVRHDCDILCVRLCRGRLVARPARDGTPPLSRHRRAPFGDDMPGERKP